jgi:hypothetical protein
VHEQVVQPVHRIEAAQQPHQLRKRPIRSCRDRRGLVVPERRTTGRCPADCGGEQENQRRIPPRGEADLDVTWLEVGPD